MSQILDEKQLEELLENGRRQRDADRIDMRCKLIPRAYLHLPNSPPSSWLLASISPHDHDVAFGLMSLGGGIPELGYVRLSELESLRGYKNRGVYNDPLFRSARELDILEYVEMAKITGQIVLEFDG